jgi:hypothetical protein
MHSEIGSTVEATVMVYLRHFPRISLEGLRKKQKASVRIAKALAKLQKGSHGNTHDMLPLFVTCSSEWRNK